MTLFRTTCSLILIASGALADDSGDRLHQIEHFFENADVVAGPSLVDCTLSGGTKTTCFSITVVAEPQSYTPGPWCPSSIEDDASAGGIWLQDGQVYDVDGAFIANLGVFYDDETWQLFDPATGQIDVTDTQMSCEAAARPDVDPEYQNHCVVCEIDYMPEDATMTYVIPLVPEEAAQSTPTNRTGSGVAFNGVRLDGPAPVDAILSAYTLAPFDDCGGHVNTHVGYHYHAVTGCLDDGPIEEDHAVKIGIAMDGYGIFNRTLVDGSLPSDLDECHGHESDGLGYHYHAGDAGGNLIVGCLKAEAGCASGDPDAVCDASVRRRRP